MNDQVIHVPEILAPAGSKASFLAALAAGADAVYCGLKRYSARMAATNFSMTELADLTQLAHARGGRVYVTVNSLIKPSELDDTARLIHDLERDVHPDALILQDLAVVHLARRMGFSGELHLSTLANAGMGKDFSVIREKLGIDRVVVPRELSIDEIRMLAQACPPGLGLEVFIHGALCYAVSGRCYWSSYMGGKSGLRGRCVQPCRRWYTQANNRHRAFSCQDLSLDVLTKIIKAVPRVTALKIEGRKKGPHYVYYTVSAYRMLRDEGGDPKAKRAALDLLAHSLGRSGTHYGFLPQRPQHPVQKTRQTGSGLFIGRIRGGKTGPHIIPRETLLAGDALRVGYEDEPWHAQVRVSRAVPKKGKFRLPAIKGKKPPDGTAVFLTDRTEPALAETIERLNHALEQLPKRKTGQLSLGHDLPAVPRTPLKSHNAPVRVMDVFRNVRRGSSGNQVGLWLSDQTLRRVGAGKGGKVVWWLPPVAWPRNQDEFIDQIGAVLKKGGKRFVLNTPWQIALFDNIDPLDLWAGPFCNLANPWALEMIADLGFAGAILSPELGQADYLAMPQQSPLPLGLVISGNYPLCISRNAPESIRADAPFASPRGEEAWAVPYGENFWVYPNWAMDLRGQQKGLEKAGYRLFVNLVEPIPKRVTMKHRPGVWNRDHGLQ